MEQRVWKIYLYQHQLGAGRGEQVGLALGAGIFYRLRDVGPQEGEIYESGMFPWCVGLRCALEGPGRQNWWNCCSKFRERRGVVIPRAGCLTHLHMPPCFVLPREHGGLEGCGLWSQAHLESRPSSTLRTKWSLRNPVSELQVPHLQIEAIIWSTMGFCCINSLYTVGTQYMAAILFIRAPTQE